MVRRTTWIVLAIFVVFLGVFIYLQTKEEALPEEQVLQSTSEAQMFDILIDDVTGLRVVGSDGKVFYATRKGPEEWEMIQPDLSDPVDGVKLDTYVTQFLTLTPLSRLEASLGEEALGLIRPRFTIRLSLVGGEEKLLEVGDQTPTSSGYYMRVDNTDLVVVPSFNLESILALVEVPPLVPTPTPEFSPTPVQEEQEPQSTETPEY